jgi:hypothetical protein
LADAHGVRGDHAGGHVRAPHAALAWELMIPLRQALARFAHRFERDGS